MCIKNNVYVSRIKYVVDVRFNFSDVINSNNKNKYIKAMIIIIIIDLNLGVNIVTNDNIPFINLNTYKKDIFKNNYTIYDNMLKSLFNLFSNVNSKYILQLVNIKVNKNIIQLHIEELM